MNPVKALQDHGQAVWLDFLSRDFIADGGLKKLVDEDGLRGVTSNPSFLSRPSAAPKSTTTPATACWRAKTIRPAKPSNSSRSRISAMALSLPAWLVAQRSQSGLASRI